MFKLGVTDREQIMTMMNLLTAVPSREFVALVLSLQARLMFDVIKRSAVEAFGSTTRWVYFIATALGVQACITARLVGNVSKYMD